MTLDVWLDNALRDAKQRDLGDLGPLLEALARSTALLRDADWNVDLSAATDGSQGPRGS